MLFEEDRCDVCGQTAIAFVQPNNSKGGPKCALHAQTISFVTLGTRTVAGALFDFAGYLTTRPKGLRVGSSHNAVPMVEALKAWADLRGLSLDEADVRDWELALGLAPAERSG